MPVTGYDRIIREVNLMLQTDRIMTAATNAVLSRQKERIFEEGKDSSGGQIGTYSTKPTYIARNQQSRNTGRTKFPGGYRQYKQLTGKSSGKVVLRDTNQMMMDLGTHVLGNHEYGIGFTNSLNKKKADWMEAKYRKDIFSSTEREDELFQRVVEFELNRID